MLKRILIDLCAENRTNRLAEESLTACEYYKLSVGKLSKDQGKRTNN